MMAATGVERQTKKKGSGAAAAAAPPPSCRRRRVVALPPPPLYSTCEYKRHIKNSEHYKSQK
jgi:hypothetical protein